MTNVITANRVPWRQRGDVRNYMDEGYTAAQARVPISNLQRRHKNPGRPNNIFVPVVGGFDCLNIEQGEILIRRRESKRMQESRLDLGEPEGFTSFNGLLDDNIQKHSDIYDKYEMLGIVSAESIRIDRQNIHVGDGGFPPVAYAVTGVFTGYSPSDPIAVIVCIGRLSVVAGHATDIPGHDPGALPLAGIGDGGGRLYRNRWWEIAQFRPGRSA